jgi:hypothetical protein
LLLILIGADAARGLRIQDTGRLPAIYERFKVCHGYWQTVEHIPESQREKKAGYRKHSRFFS